MDENKDEINLKQESDMARMERSNKRFFTLCLIIFLAFCLTNGWWIWRESQFEDSITVTQDTPNGNNSYIGHDGSITNGTADNN